MKKLTRIQSEIDFSKKIQYLVPQPKQIEFSFMKVVNELDNMNSFFDQPQ